MISINIEKKLKTYNGWKELRINKKFAERSTTVIYGESGAGKTTFLKIIAGFINPEKGKISFRDVQWLNTDQKIAVPPQLRKIGFVFQEYALFPNMTVIEHLRYAVKDEPWIQRLLKIGKLENLINHKPPHLSGGQQQRLAIIRALAPKPSLLLMDEPFSALDHYMKIQLLYDLKILFAELELTTIIVTHNRQELNGVCDSEFELSTE